MFRGFKKGGTSQGSLQFNLDHTSGFSVSSFSVHIVLNYIHFVKANITEQHDFKTSFFVRRSILS